MTSRVETPVEGREEKGKGVGRRFLSRMRTVLKRTDPSKRQPTGPTTETPQPGPSSAAAGPSTEPNAAAAATTRQQPQQAKGGATQHVDVTLPKSHGEKLPRAKVYGDRYQQISDRYGLETDPSRWYEMEGHVMRINKPLRMRVHRQCHQCGGGVDADGVCEKCNHSFCRQCTRYPPKRTEAEKAVSREKRANILKERSANAIIPPDWSPDPKVTVVLKKPAPKKQQELIYKKVRQRVRRMCCQCQDNQGAEVLFQRGQRNCPKCDHVRCTDCPRDPPKKAKYPYGYPGDEFGAKSIPHHRCHECRSKFPPGVENGTTCAVCSHEKCDDCERLMPHKVRPEPDPEVMRSVEEKLAGLSVA